MTMVETYRHYFNQLADTWQLRVDHRTDLTGYMKRFGVRSGDRILDVGAGVGRLTRCLVQLVGPRGFVVADDISEKMLIEGKKAITASNVGFVSTDACDLSIRPEIFHKVICFSTFPHICDPVKALCEFNRVLSPGGKLLIFHTCCSIKLNRFHSTLSGVVCHDRLPKAEDMVPLLQCCGFTTERTEERQDLYWLEAVKKSRR
jgi:ubiquinone/menaquinone biosynthesis C-methylase UbiE